MLCRGLETDENRGGPGSSIEQVPFMTVMWGYHPLDVSFTHDVDTQLDAASYGSCSMQLISAAADPGRTSALLSLSDHAGSNITGLSRESRLKKAKPPPGDSQSVAVAALVQAVSKSSS